jgi:acyl carrier protein
VVARAQRDETTEIVAYVTGQDIDPAALRKRAATRLPHFMVPAAVVVLDALPLTPTGKIDVNALPEPTRATGGQTGPRTDVEQLVADAWCAALGVPEIGLRENFFDVGGHSLLMAAVARRLEDKLGRPIPLHRMFQYPTVAGLAAFLTEESTADGLAKVVDRMARRRRARRTGER